MNRTGVPVTVPALSTNYMKMLTSGEPEELGAFGALFGKSKISYM